MTLVRFGVSIEEELLKSLDAYVSDNQFPNRSQAIRQLIADKAIKEKFRHNELVAGAITLFYGQQKVQLLQYIQAVQQEYLSVVISSMHCHIDHENMMLIIGVKGFAYYIQEFADKLIAIKGIVYGSLSIIK